MSLVVCVVLKTIVCYTRQAKQFFANFSHILWSKNPVLKKVGWGGRGTKTYLSIWFFGIYMFVCLFVCLFVCVADSHTVWHRDRDWLKNVYWVGCPRECTFFFICSQDNQGTPLGGNSVVLILHNVSLRWSADWSLPHDAMQHWSKFLTP
jgi:hypothetical protein